VIFFLGDGMGISTVTAARILAGQQLGGPGEEHSLSFDNFPVTGLAHTYNVNSQTAGLGGHDERHDDRCENRHRRLRCRRAR
jgi:alkaline phosphatase